jgi:hypothetical protein
MSVLIVDATPTNVQCLVPGSLPYSADAFFEEFALESTFFKDPRPRPAYLANWPSSATKPPASSPAAVNNARSLNALAAARFTRLGLILGRGLEVSAADAKTISSTATLSQGKSSWSDKDDHPRPKLRANFTEVQRHILNSYLKAHQAHPYANATDMMQLRELTGLSVRQIRTYLTNGRMRFNPHSPKTPENTRSP